MSSGPNSPQLPQDSSVQIGEEQVIGILTHGQMQERGVLPYSSNHGFLVTLAHDTVSLPAVYKPQRGESPLWDFEWGSLCLRETAAYVVSQGLGWHLVPPTVLRHGTRGLGSVQFFVQCQHDDHYFTIQSDARFAEVLRQLVLFDCIINNADRKSGHCLIGFDRRLWAIDHGVCFHVEHKLRTVIWEFSRERIEPSLMDALAAFNESLVDHESALAKTLCQLLSSQEIAALIRRVGRLLRTGIFPAPSPQRRNYPWPPI